MTNSKRVPVDRLESAIDMLRKQPEDCLGHVADSDGCSGWWIRDELIDSLCKVRNALSAAPDDTLVCRLADALEESMEWNWPGEASGRPEAWNLQLINEARGGACSQSPQPTLADELVIYCGGGLGCGEITKVDEDGCCLTCGADSVVMFYEVLPRFNQVADDLEALQKTWLGKAVLLYSKNVAADLQPIIDKLRGET